MTLNEYLALVESQRHFAKRLGVSTAAVWQWVNKRTSITPARAMQIEAATEGQVRKHELRPDIWPVD